MQVTDHQKVFGVSSLYDSLPVQSAQELYY